MTVLVALFSVITAADAGYPEGLTALREGDASQAVEHFQAALEEGGRHPSVYHGLGNALYRLDRKPEAAAAWRRGLGVVLTSKLIPGLQPWHELCSMPQLSTSGRS